jgi:hypothetical protein
MFVARGELDEPCLNFTRLNTPVGAELTHRLHEEESAVPVGVADERLSTKGSAVFPSRFSARPCGLSRKGDLRTTLMSWTIASGEPMRAKAGAIHSLPLRDSRMIAGRSVASTALRYAITMPARARIVQSG